MERNLSRRQTDEMPPAYVLAPMHLPNAASAAQGMLDKALAYCAAQMRLSSPEEALESLRRGDRVTRWYCHHSLGGQAAEILGDLDDTVQQVLVFDLESPPEDLISGEPVPTLPVHLVIQVRRKTETLRALIQGLEHALVKEYAGAVGHGKEDRLLEVQVIDADDIEKRRGYSRLLGSLLECPVQVWQR
jgi:hypothetical protein